MVLGVAGLGDEKFELLDDAGVTNVYWYRFPESAGAQGGGSVSPFSPKSTTGARSYQDYDPESAVALTDLTSGMGQETLTDATQYYTAVNLDARGGKLVLGPLPHATTATGELSDPAMLQWETPIEPAYSGTGEVIVPGVPDGSGWGTTEVAPDFGERHWATFGMYRTRIGVSFTVATAMTAMDRVWLYLKGPAVAADTLTVSVHATDTATGLPRATVLHSGTLSGKTLLPTGGWIEVVFGGPLSFVTGITYWLVLSLTSANNLDDYGWYGSTQLGSNGRVQYTATSQWLWDILPADAADDYVPYSDALAHFANLLFWYTQPYVQPAAPPHFLRGAGEDGVQRMWLWAGRHLYYMGAASTPVLVQVIEPGTTTAFPWEQGEIQTCCWFKGSGDTYPYLYIAIKPATVGLPAYIYRCDADVLGGLTWTALPAALKAVAFTVQDDILWRATATNLVCGTLSGLWNDATASAEPDSVAVGDLSYPIRNMLTWNGALYVGKDDGLYKVVYPTGYPLVAGAPTCSKIIDFGAQVASNNFELMVEHQGDLYFSLGLGLLRLTASNVLTVVTPELGLELNAGARGLYRCAVSSLNVLWVGVEGQGNVDSLSYILACVDGHWHPLSTLQRGADMLRSLALDGGLYGTLPRIWYGEGLVASYLQMPTQTQKRWLYATADYRASGYLLTSWIDGNIRTIEKDWVTVQVVCRNVGAVAATAGYVEIYWRPDDTTTWEEVGTITAEGLTTLPMPTVSHGVKCQLKIKLVRATGDVYATPIVEAVLIKYLERPPDAKHFTRTYELTHLSAQRSGAVQVLSLAEQLTGIETLRNSAQPLTWTAWFGKTYKVHITQYSWTDICERLNDQADTGSIMVSLELMEVAS